jgi:C4-dicarboxylate-specific signal transduction histidine kinase
LIEFKTDSSGHTILFSDNGSGVSPGIADKIFLPFFTSKGPTGIGLGLTIVRDTVRKYGGDASVQSPGKLGGATFKITLPLTGK